MWLAMLKRAIAGPTPLVAAKAKAIRAPSPATHNAGRQPARAAQRPAGGTEAQVGCQATHGAHGGTG